MGQNIKNMIISGMCLNTYAYQLSANLISLRSQVPNEEITVTGDQNGCEICDPHIQTPITTNFSSFHVNNIPNGKWRHYCKQGSQCMWNSWCPPSNTYRQQFSTNFISPTSRVENEGITVIRTANRCQNHHPDDQIPIHTNFELISFH